MMVAFASVALAEVPPVRVEVHAPANLADAGTIPTVVVDNRGDTPATIELFLGVPFLWLETPEAQVDDPGAVCGGGYVPKTLPAHEAARFPLWTRAADGPNVSGEYRVVLPYTQAGAHLARSDVFSLRYGDVAPAGWIDGTPPGRVRVGPVVGQRVREGIDPPPAPVDALMPAVERCVAEAQARIPWLRGSFALRVHGFPGRAPVLYVEETLLGDVGVGACLGAIEPPAVDGNYRIALSVGR